MTLDEEADLRLLAREIAEHPWMPPIYHLAAELDPGLGRRGILRSFLISRWDMVREEPDPERWAKEFIKAGGPKRLGTKILLWLFGTAAVLFGLSLLLTAFAENPGGWYDTLVCLTISLLVTIGCAVSLRRDWQSI
jgi:hypothetical protein